MRTLPCSMSVNVSLALPLSYRVTCPSSSDNALENLLLKELPWPQLVLGEGLCSAVCSAGLPGSLSITSA